MDLKSFADGEISVNLHESVRGKDGVLFTQGVRFRCRERSLCGPVGLRKSHRQEECQRLADGAAAAGIYDAAPQRR